MKTLIGIAIASSVILAGLFFWPLLPDGIVIHQAGVFQPIPIDRDAKSITVTNINEHSNCFISMPDSELPRVESSVMLAPYGMYTPRDAAGLWVTCQHQNDVVSVEPSRAAVQ